MATARSRYIVGVDLGTTNTAVAFVDTRAADPRVESLEIPQLVAPGSIDGRRQLPSFVYLAGEHDLSPAETALPWNAESRVVVGELARSQGARQPSRMIASAKSWLCHGGVDRHAAILPWGIEDGPKLSPVDSSARVLEHVRQAWDHLHPDDRFADQDLVITVPASFDEAARELTVEAAGRAGLRDVVLLEEPQAAFYAWMNGPRGGTKVKPSSRVRARAANELRAGDRVLVFDVGGGTTDFTVISVGVDGKSFERTAVGDHLLLGGDNIDLTLAKVLEARLGEQLGGKKLDLLQWHGLVHACRLAKETLLGNPDVSELPITVSGRSSKLVGSTLRDRLTRDELERIVHDGFFPETARHETPRRLRGGLQEFGLPYAADAAITRHLAVFLNRHAVGRVDAVLFNGGAMTPQTLRQRVLDQIARWQPDGAPPHELTSAAPELAVAVGAAQYGLVRRGLGARIGGGTPRAYYVGVGRKEGRDRAVCLAGKGLGEGSAVELQRDFVLVTNRPVSFKLYSSTTRTDRPGAVLGLIGAEAGTSDATTATVAAAGASDDSADLVELPPIVTALRAPGRGEVTVHLEVRVTELGALEIWCAEPGAPAAEPGWRLSFDMRAGGARVEAAPEAVSATFVSGPVVVDPRLDRARARLRDLFTGPPEPLAKLMRELEEALEAPRDEWPVPTARALFDAAFEVEEQRKRSPQHEARWLNFTGFCLRPGTGAPLDDWRAKQMWRIFNEDLVHASAEQCRLAWWIAWRRIAGGLGKGHQHQIYLRLAQLFLPGAKGRKKWDEVKPSAEEAAEMLRCVANMERISAESKIPLGDEVIRRFESRKAREDMLNLWALSRLGARVPLYGPLNTVVPASKAAAWLAAVLAYDWPQPQRIAFSLAQIARRTGDRARDLDDEARARVATWLRAAGADRAAALVEQVVALEAREEYIALGDTLPPGLRLVGDEGNG